MSPARVLRVFGVVLGRGGGRLALSTLLSLSPALHSTPPPAGTRPLRAEPGPKWPRCRLQTPSEAWVLPVPSWYVGDRRCGKDLHGAVGSPRAKPTLADPDLVFLCNEQSSSVQMVVPVPLGVQTVCGVPGQGELGDPICRSPTLP